MTRCKKVAMSTTVGTVAAVAFTFVFPIAGAGWLAINWSLAAASAASGAVAGLGSSALALSLPGNEVAAIEIVNDDVAAALKRKLDDLEAEIKVRFGEG